MLAMVDASIGAIGLAVIVWIVVLSGGVAGTGPTFAALVNASYPVFDILIVTLLVRLALADRSREPADWWLLGGFSLMLVTDLAYAWLLRGSPDAYSPFLDLGWLVSYVAIGAAALHPSMVNLTRREAPEGVLSPIDVVWLGIPRRFGAETSTGLELRGSPAPRSGRRPGARSRRTRTDRHLRAS